MPTKNDKDQNQNSHNSIVYHLDCSSEQDKENIKERFENRGIPYDSPKKGTRKKVFFRSPDHKKPVETRETGKRKRNGQDYVNKRQLHMTRQKDSQSKIKIKLSELFDYSDESIHDHIVSESTLPTAPETEIRKFGDRERPITIDIANNKLPKKSSRRWPSQKQVMDNHSANEALRELIKYTGCNKSKRIGQFNIENNAKMQWCHLVAFCLANGVSNPQTKNNLAAGTSVCNSNMRNFEVYFNNLVKEREVEKMELWGQAEIIKESDVAIYIHLDVRRQWKDGQYDEFSLVFHPQSDEKYNPHFLHSLKTIDEYYNDRKIHKVQHGSTSSSSLDEDDEQKLNQYPMSKAV